MFCVFGEGSVAVQLRCCLLCELGAGSVAVQ